MFRTTVQFGPYHSGYGQALPRNRQGYRCTQRIYRNQLSCNHYRYFVNVWSYGGKDFPGGSDGKAAYNVGDLGSIPGLGLSPGEGNDNPLQYSCLENPMEEPGRL